MIRKQLTLIVLVAIVCAIGNQVGGIVAAPAKCPQTGCWNIQPDESWFSGVGHCFSYNNPHNAGNPMSTGDPVGGTRTLQTGQYVAMYKSAGNCSAYCFAGGSVQAEWSGDWEALDPVQKYLCQ